MNVKGAYQSLERSLQDSISDCQTKIEKAKRYLLDLEKRVIHAKRVALLSHLLRVMKSLHVKPLDWLPKQVSSLADLAYDSWYEACLSKQDDFDALASHLMTPSLTSHGAVVSNKIFMRNVEANLASLLGVRSLDYQRWPALISCVFGRQQDPVEEYKSSFPHVPCEGVFGDLVSLTSETERRKEKWQVLLGALTKTCEDLEKKRSEIKRKGRDFQIEQAHIHEEEEQLKRSKLLGSRCEESPTPAFLGKERHKRVEVLRKEMTVLDAQACYREGLNEKALDMIQAALQTKKHLPIQVILPGLSLTQEKVRALAKKMPDRKIVFLGSEQGPYFGKRVIYDFHKDTFEELQFPFAGDLSCVLMLYDNSNKQGGDFGSLSVSRQDLPLAQFVFLNIVDRGRPLPAETMTEIDLCQALYRARGPYADAYVYCAQDREHLLDRLKINQQLRERLTAHFDVTEAIINRMVKAKRWVEKAKDASEADELLKDACDQLFKLLESYSSASSSMQKIVAAYDQLTRFILERLDQPESVSLEAIKNSMVAYQSLVEASHLIKEVYQLCIDNSEALAPV